MAYYEPRETGNPFRAEYLEGMQKLIEKRQAEANEARKDFDRALAANPEEYRVKLAEMFGWPLTERFAGACANGTGECASQAAQQTSGTGECASQAAQQTGYTAPKVKKQFVAKDGEYSIYRMQLEVMPDFWYYGILFVKEDGKKRPFVLSQHGGLGTPEVISSFFNGNSGNYNEMTNRVLAKDVNVFAPQMLLWGVDTYGNEYDRAKMDAQLKQCGSSMVAVELYALMRSLDYFEKESYVDPERIGMVGMSYGGMYTIYLAAVDTRIRSAVSSSFFNRHYAVQFIDWAFQDAGSTFMDAEMVMLVRPRKIYLAMGDKDPLFVSEDSKREFERIKAIYPDWEQWCDLKIFEGPHEFIRDDAFIDRMIGDLQSEDKSL